MARSLVAAASRRGVCLVLPVLALAFAVFGMAGLAVAAPGDPMSVAAVAPAAGVVVTGTVRPTLTATVADGVAPITGTFVVDGASYPAVADVAGTTFSCTMASDLADGPHAASFTAVDALGATATQDWTFDVDWLPLITRLEPRAGTWDEQFPYVYANVRDNAPLASFSMTLDGRAVEAAQSFYHPQLGYEIQVGGRPGWLLANGPHTAVVTVRDAQGREASATSSWTVFNGGEISITASGIAEGSLYTTAYPSAHFTATSGSSSWGMGVYIDSRDGNHNTTPVLSNANKTADTTMAPRWAVPDGPHTIVVKASNSAYKTAARLFHIEVQVPPTVFHLRPSPDVASANAAPLLVARATDNSTGTPTFTFKVDGAVVPSSGVRTIAQSRWEGTAQVTVPLAADTTHTAEVTVRDAAGNETVQSWSFFVLGGTPMAHYDASAACEDCHTNYQYVHSQEIIYSRMYPCNSCHPTWHGGPSERPATIDDPSTYVTCYGSCHKRTGVIPAHPGYYNAMGCRSCHESINAFNQQGEPEALNGRGSTLPLMAETPKHTVGRDMSLCGDCHKGDLTFEHQGRLDASGDPMTCRTCHASGDAAVAAAVAAGDTDCRACHSSAPHPGLAAAHSLTSSSAWVPIFANHDGLGPKGADVACSTCHASTQLMSAHGNDCDMCHAAGGPIASFSGWNGTCQQGACHPAIHASADTAHTAIANASCETCHEQDWSVSPSLCGNCHSASEAAAPSTVSDLKASYVGAASIVLRASDPAPSSGLHRTYYRLDGGPAIAGTLVRVPGPASGTQSHALESWSVDNAGNVEAAHAADFTIAADTVQPVTNSDAKPSYIGIATVRLTATDNGSDPVRGTYYRLDGGVATVGTTMTVPGPASGTATHTVEFWTVDAAGNEELPHKMATFAIAGDSAAPVTTSNAPLYDRTSGPLRVDFTATDAGSGVAQTYVKVNGSAPYAGTWYLISKLGVNTIEFWSVDTAGNEELPHKTATMVKDPWAPSTTSDAKGSYVGSAVVRLTPTDAGAAGVATTWYTIDGGAQNSGTLVTVTAIGTHTLRYWSVDRAGNVEAVKSVTFSVTAAAPATGTVVLRWDAPPPGSWTYYYVRDAAGALVASGYNTTGTFTATVPVSALPYSLSAHWYDSESDESSMWTYGTALVDAPGKTVTWWY